MPLSAIAREAGVGQGVLYRHFPTRIDLALAVFEENFAELESLATDARPGAFTTVWNRLVELTISEAAFLEAVIDARRTLPDYDGGQRLRSTTRLGERAVQTFHRLYQFQAEGFCIILFVNQTQELPATSHVTAFAHIDEPAGVNR